MKYYLRHRFLGNAVNSYLNHDHLALELKLSTNKQSEEVQTKFTKGEIKEIKEKYNTELRDFEIIEAGKWNYK